MEKEKTTGAPEKEQEKNGLPVWMFLLVILAFLMSLLTAYAIKKNTVERQALKTIGAYIEEKYSAAPDTIQLHGQGTQNWLDVSTFPLPLWYTADVTLDGREFTVVYFAHKEPYENALHTYHNILDNGQAEEIDAALREYMEGTMADIDFGEPALYTITAEYGAIYEGENEVFDSVTQDTLFCNTLYTGENIEEVYHHISSKTYDFHYTYYYTDGVDLSQYADSWVAGHAFSGYRLSEHITMIQLKPGTDLGVFADIVMKDVDTMGESKTEDFLQYAPYIEYVTGFFAAGDELDSFMMYYLDVSELRLDFSLDKVDGVLVYQQKNTATVIETLGPDAAIPQHPDSETPYLVPLTDIYSTDTFISFLIPIEEWQELQQEYPSISLAVWPEEGKYYHIKRYISSDQYGGYYVFPSIRGEFCLAIVNPDREETVPE